MGHERTARRGRRPDVFDRAQLEDGLRRHGCAEPYIDAYVGDFKLMMPLLLRELGANGVLAVVNRSRPELGLKDQDSYWDEGAKYFVGWATDVIEAYKASKGLTGPSD